RPRPRSAGRRRGGRGRERVPRGPVRRAGRAGRAGTPADGRHPRGSRRHRALRRHQRPLAGGRRAGPRDQVPAAHRGRAARRGGHPPRRRQYPRAEAMTSQLARLEVRDPAGAFAARQLGRGLAGVLDLDRQDQVRVATALSEISRSAVTAGRRIVITFGIDDADLVLTVAMDGTPPSDGIGPAERLMDEVTVDGDVVRMTKRRPPGVRPDRRLISEQLAAAHSQSALDELRRQNQDLITALDDLRQQKNQLVALNAELQEPNRGVMAMYSELSSELEQTNRGVVALYAELDETSERLRAASESKDRFWANVSHELRTPLNSIIGLARLLAEPEPD